VIGRPAVAVTAVGNQRYDTAMSNSVGRDWRYNVGLSGLMLVILIILWFTGNLRQAPPLIVSVFRRMGP
jgi:hypothetical protein